MAETPHQTPPGSSPHTRGAREGLRQRRQDSGIIPAYAGSTLHHHEIISCSRGSSPHTRGARRGSNRPPRYRLDHPRIRGEHPVADVDPESLTRIIPAYAGSTSMRPRLKRARGGSSPHTRGARLAGERCHPGVGIIPAYAGSTLIDSVLYFPVGDHPRIRGEHGPPTPVNSASSGSSPHTRGARQSRRVGGDDVGIIPAYAGSTRSPPSRTIS